jgi:hypothetical protein
MALTLIKLPVQSEDDERSCYLRDGTTTPVADGFPVLQHCIMVQKRHFDRWKPTGQFYEIEAGEDGKPQDAWGSIPRLKDANKLADGDAFVDLETFAGDYYPVYAVDGMLKRDCEHVILNKQECKSLVIYVLEDAGTLRTFVIIVDSRGFGMGDIGAARTDPASEIDYYWYGDEAFGYSLALDMDRYVGPEPDDFVPVRTDKQGRPYYRCCDPGIAHSAHTRTLYPTDAEVVMYKRFKGVAEWLYPGDADVSDNGLKRKKKNRPYQPNGVRLVGLLASRDALSKDYKTAVRKKRKNREFDEEDNREVERGTGDEAAQGILISKSGTKRGAMPKTPTARANGIVEGSKTVRNFLATRKITLDGGKLRTDQEWCHLLAASLTGKEACNNFVLGSRHCNSEQLAIETALLYSLDPVMKADRSLRVKITAYVVPDSDFLLGEVIRYKVLMSHPDGKDRLLLDHLIDAQSESFSLPEYRVLQETVRRVIAVELGGEHLRAYESRTNQRIAARRQQDGLGYRLSYKVQWELRNPLSLPEEEEDEEMGEGSWWLRSMGEPPAPEDEDEDDDVDDEEEMTE